jgi:hypothetical protein
MTEERSFVPLTVGNAVNAGSNLEPGRLRHIIASLTAPEWGLGLAVNGAAYTAYEIIDLYWQRSLWTSLGFWLFLAASVIASMYIPRYYRSRFGWVQQKLLPVNPARELGLVILVGFLITSVFVGMVLQAALQLPDNFIIAVRSAGFLCLIIGCAFTARGQSMGGRLVIWAALVVVQGLIALLPLWVSLGPHQQAVWKLLNAGSLGILVMVVGISNHAAMVRMLPKRVEEDGQ